MSEGEGGRTSVRVVVRGGVQGVGFRAWLQHQAELHAVEGWVRNRRDGSVEALLSGSADAIALMLKAVRQGPRGSQVESVEEGPPGSEDLAEAKGGGFAQLPSI
jgi:acylphosphatase